MAEQRYQAVLAVIADGLSVTQVAEKVGVSRQTIHTWLARMRLRASRGCMIGRIGRSGARKEVRKKNASVPGGRV